SIESVYHPGPGLSASDIATRLIDAAERTSVFSLMHQDLGEKYRLDPAPIFAPVCGGASYPRTYRLQARILHDAARARSIAIEKLSDDIAAFSRDGKRVLFCFGIPDRTLLA